MLGPRVRAPAGSPNNGSIAQLVEQGAVNAQVVGSEPATPAKILNGKLAWKQPSFKELQVGIV